MKCRGLSYASAWSKMSSVETFQLYNLSEAPCKNMTVAEELGIDRCCKMSQDLNKYMPQIFTVMKYAQQAPHSIESEDDFLASFGDMSFLRYPTKTYPSKTVANPAIPMCQYAG